MLLCDMPHATVRYAIYAALAVPSLCSCTSSLPRLCCCCALHVFILSLSHCWGCAVHWFILKDSAMLNANLVPAPALCASQEDMYDTSTRLCQVRVPSTCTICVAHLCML